MAQAAAAAAAALTLRNLTISTADKQLESMYKTVEKLQDVGFPKFQEQLIRQAFACEWEDCILDATQPVPAAHVITLKTQRDLRNAYLLIMSKCDGHPVENVLEACAQGDAQAAFVAVRNYFHRSTQAGVTAAYKSFFTATMANTNSNITQWIAVVPRLAKILISSGGQAGATAQLSIFLDGLLPEFDQIKTFLDQVAGLDYDDACRRTMDYAMTKSLMELTKNGVKNVKNNTFAFDNNAKPPSGPIGPPQFQCRGWVSPGGCRYGKNCKFPHTGPGKEAPAHKQWPQYPGRHEKSEVKGAEHPAPPQSSNNASSNSVVDPQSARVKGAIQTAPPHSPSSSISAKCNYCNGNHLMRKCPALATDNDNGTSNVSMVDGTTGVDHVFMTDEQQRTATNDR